MGRYVFRHHFCLILCGCLCFTAISRGATNPNLGAPLNTPLEQTPPLPSSSPQTPPGELNSNAEKATEQYALSHERYEKAVAYSKAGYTLYFVSYALSGIVLFLMLRLGVAAKFPNELFPSRAGRDFRTYILQRRKSARRARRFPPIRRASLARTFFQMRLAPAARRPPPADVRSAT